MLPVSLDCFCLTTKQKQSRETGNIGYKRRRTTKQKQSRETGNIGYKRRRTTKQKQSRETFCFVVLRLLYPMLPVSMDCIFLILSVFSNVYLHRHK
jgi:hypothetical protein